MATEKAVQARNRGRYAVAARTVWSIDIGGARFRCVAKLSGGYSLEIRTDAGWQATAQHADALHLWQRLVTRPAIEKAVTDQARWIAEAE